MSTPRNINASIRQVPLSGSRNGKTTCHGRLVSLLRARKGLGGCFRSSNGLADREGAVGRTPACRDRTNLAGIGEVVKKTVESVTVQS